MTSILKVFKPVVNSFSPAPFTLDVEISGVAIIFILSTLLSTDKEYEIVSGLKSGTIF